MSIVIAAIANRQLADMTISSEILPG